jgi:hypothetical protein
MLIARPDLAAARPPADHVAVLQRGVNLTNWFRFPADAGAAAIRAYLGDAALEDLREAGFTFVRLAVEPEYLHGDASRRAVLVEQIARVQRHGLAVIVALHPQKWRLESSPADRAALLDTWRSLAPALRKLNPVLTVPEVLNEPVFPGSANEWMALQESARVIIRSALPANTIILTGNDWGSISGLLAMPASQDPNVVYSFHFYDPTELTSLAAWRPGLDTALLARLPFPTTDSPSCNSVVSEGDSPTAEVARFYCAQKWSAASVAERIRLASDWARRRDTVLLAGEFGATTRLNRSARLAWIASVRRACEAEGIGWALWGYEDIMGLAIPRPPGTRPRLDEGVLEALGLRFTNRPSNSGSKLGIGAEASMHR